MKYVSSIITKYGDLGNVKADVKTLNDILNRQGSSLLIDVIAESTGRSAVKFKFSGTDRKNITNNLINELKEALLERL